MKKWTEFFRQSVRPEYEAQVMTAAEKELQALVPERRLFSRWKFLAGFAAAALAVIFVVKRPSEIVQEDFELLNSDPELLGDLDLFEDLEIIEAFNDETGDLDS
ncbi:MAG: hypothetical protein A2Z20_08280 [Bdellovibrionales bacterium RBG_16_40_8]|nr:MAG: hypothetical protein A2Z20_08280 [Bdellovibrionales bacterium RBG_16_40_8]